MKRVRYLAGAAGLAPMVLGAVAGGGAHTAADVTGHGTTAAPYARAHRGPVPDITREDCFSIGLHHWLAVWQSYSNGEDCFAQAGAENVKIYNFDYIWTGNNGVYFSLYYKGNYYPCEENFKSAYIHAKSCGVPNNAGTLTYLSIFPGIG
jgi:hypothetical protein